VWPRTPEPAEAWSSYPSPRRSRRVVDAGSPLVPPFFASASGRTFELPGWHTRRFVVEDLDALERTLRLAGNQTARAD